MATAPSVKRAEDHGQRPRRARPSGRCRACPSRGRPRRRDRKSSALKMAWFQTWSTAAPSPRTTSSGACGRASDDGQTDAHHDDADVLDAVVREESLEVVLRNGERDSGDAARRPEQEQQDAPGNRRLRQHREHADDPVDADLDEDTRHQGGYVARSARMGGRKPHVERHHAGLDAKGDEGQKEQHAPRPETRCFPARRPSARRTR